MLSVEIEKEIQQENKVLLNFNLRQVICLCVAAVLSVVCAVFLDMEFSLAVYPCMVVGGVCFAFGWWKPDGLPMERVWVKKMQTLIYKNNVRLYKTKNRYIIMLNREYDRRRAEDLKDRRIRRQLRRERRILRKKRRRSRLCGIV
jgi:hypothetical protein